MTLYKDRLPRYSSQQSHDATQKYLELADEWGMTLAQMSLAFITQQPFLTATIIGATTMDQLKENIDSVNITLSKDQLKEIDKVQELIPNPAP